MLLPRSSLPQRMRFGTGRRGFGFFPWHRARRWTPLSPKDIAARCGGARWPAAGRQEPPTDRQYEQQPKVWDWKFGALRAGEPWMKGWTWEYEVKNGRVTKNRKKTFGCSESQKPMQEWKIPELSNNDIDFITMRRRVPENQGMGNVEQSRNTQKGSSFSDWRNQPQQRQDKEGKKGSDVLKVHTSNGVCFVRMDELHLPWSQCSWADECMSEQNERSDDGLVKLDSTGYAAVTLPQEGKSATKGSDETPKKLEASIPSSRGDQAVRTEATKSSIGNNPPAEILDHATVNPSSTTSKTTFQKSFLVKNKTDSEEMADRLPDLFRKHHEKRSREEMESLAKIRVHRERVKREAAAKAQEAREQQPKPTLQKLKSEAVVSEDQAPEKIVDTSTNISSKQSPNYNDLYGRIGNQIPEKAVFDTLRDVLKGKDSSGGVTEGSGLNSNVDDLEKGTTDASPWYDNFTGEVILPEDYDSEIEDSAIYMKAQSEIVSLKQKLLDAETRAKEWEEKVRGLENSRENSERQLQELVPKIEESIAVVEKIKATVEKKQEELQTIQNECKKLGAESEAYKRKEHTFQSQIQGLHLELSTWQAKVRDLEEQKARFEKPETELKALQAEVEKLFLEVPARMEEAKKWSNEAKSARTEVEERTKEKNALELESYTLKEEVAKLTDDVRALEAEFNKWEEEVLLHESRADEAEQSLRIIQEEKDELVAEIDDLTENRDVQLEKVNEFFRQNQELEASIHENETIARNYDVMLKSREDDLVARNNELVILDTQIAGKKAELAGLEKDIENSKPVDETVERRFTPAEDIAWRNWMKKQGLWHPSSETSGKWPSEEQMDSYYLKGTGKKPGRAWRTARKMFWGAVWVGGVSGILSVVSSS